MRPREAVPLPQARPRGRSGPTRAVRATHAALGGVAVPLIAWSIQTFLPRLVPLVGVNSVPVAGAIVAPKLNGDRPWFNYEAFAEKLEPNKAEAFSWDHSYGPLRWPRDGREMLRVAQHDGGDADELGSAHGLTQQRVHLLALRDQTVHEVRILGRHGRGGVGPGGHARRRAPFRDRHNGGACGLPGARRARDHQ